MLEETQRVKESRLMLDRVLTLLREERDSRPVDVTGKDGKRELSEAITNLETACMFLVRSIYADVPYSPLPRN